MKTFVTSGVFLLAGTIAAFAQSKPGGGVPEIDATAGVAAVAALAAAVALLRERFKR